jgi:hypothetical protein
MKNLVKEKHAAGGYIFRLAEGKSNVRYSDEKKAAIIAALIDRDTDSVLLTDRGDIKRQLLNGSCQFLKKYNAKYSFES